MTVVSDLCTIDTAHVTVTMKIFYSIVFYSKMTDVFLTRDTSAK